MSGRNFDSHLLTFVNSQVLDVSRTLYDKHNHDPAYYVAKTSDGKLVVVVRGTHTKADVLTDLQVWRVKFLTGSAHKGIRMAAERLLNLLDRHLQTSDSITFIGHSLGGGIAATACCLLREHGRYLSYTRRDIAVTFGTPRLLSAALATSCQGYVCTIINEDDIVPYLSLTSSFEFLGQKVDALHVLGAFLKAVVTTQHPPGNIMHIKSELLKDEDELP
eukprot:38134-Pelagomonas_calceolata.AAC.1